MYPSGRLARSTNSNYETKWWLNDVVEEKAGVTPADNHLAKRPVKTHIFSREEIEAFAEEKLKAVKDIDKKMDFLDIIKSAVALQSSLLLTDNHAALQKGSLPLGLSIPAIPYSNQELVNLSCLVDRGREFKVDTEYESRNKFTIRVDLYKLDPM
jgi:glutaredoxin-related protein